MSTKLHIEDTDAMTAIHARMHERLVRSIPMNVHDEAHLNDLLIPGQDEAYECGRKRGVVEALKPQLHESVTDLKRELDVARMAAREERTILEEKLRTALKRCNGTGYEPDLKAQTTAHVITAGCPLRDCFADQGAGCAQGHMDHRNCPAWAGPEGDRSEILFWQKRALHAERTVMMRNRSCDKLEEAIADLIDMAASAMQSANRDGAEYNIDEHLAEYRALLTAGSPDVTDLDAMERNANRYQSLRRGSKWSVIDWKGDALTGEALDAAIDATGSTR